MSEPLSIYSPLALRLCAWAKERFPLSALISGFFSYATMILLGQFLTNLPIHLYPHDIFGALAFSGHLLILRILDEHKDYDIDLINHPQRPLQQGLITLNQLKVIALFSALLGLGWSLFCDQGIGLSTQLWAIVMGYSLLMAKEFFISAWLTRRIFLYALSHLLVSPLMMYWILCTGAKRLLWDKATTLIMAVCFISGALFELTRKCRGPEEELPKQDSYSKTLGLHGAIIAIISLNLLLLFLTVMLVQNLTENFTVPLIIVSIGFACTLYPILSFVRKPSARTRKLNEGGIGLYFLGIYAALLFIIANSTFTTL